MRVAVTGASGFVGSAVCRGAVAAGWRVYGFGRRTVELPGVHFRPWNLAGGPLPEAPAVDVVVHTAGTVTDWLPAGFAGPSDVDMLRAVLATFPGTRLVHVSTASVYDPRRPTVWAIESQAPVERYPTVYARAKAACERLLSDRPDTVILRPRAIYGPGDRTVLPRLLSSMRGHTLWLPGDGGVLQSLTSIGNAVDAVLLACSAAVTGVFNITDQAPVRLAEALAAVLAERGLPVGIRHIPVPLAQVVAAASESLSRKGPPRLTRYAVAQVAVERTLDITAARTRLGYQPTRTSFAGAASW